MNKSAVEKKSIKDYIIDNALIIALLITIVGIIIIEPSFLQWRVVTDIMTQSAVKLICALHSWMKEFMNRPGKMQLC